VTRISRREFLAASGSCAAHLALVATVAPGALRELWAAQPRGPVVAVEPFGRLERVADGVWALVSTPLNGDNTTVSNGGIVVGTHAVLAIEGFNTQAGAQWLAGKARELTGRWPTHVIVTHYHSDHSNGVAAYLADGHHAEIRATAITRDEVIARNKPADDARTSALRDAELLSPTDEANFDLGGRDVRILPHLGHTDSDVALAIDELDLVFCGDLFWNAMFPNYVDAIPGKLAVAVRTLRRRNARTYVPGHGAVGSPADFDRYAAMIDDVERAARRGHEAGLSAHDAAAAYVFPTSAGPWTLFGKTFVERAFTAWYREIDGPH
jgi:cyclase